MNRRKLREHQFRILFQTEFHQQIELPEQALFYVDALEKPSEEDKIFLLGRADKIVEKLSEIDKMIEESIEGWKLERLGKVELSILRLACYEIKFDEDIPKEVAINEAVEIAKKYAKDDAPSFINAILSKIIL